MIPYFIKIILLFNFLTGLVHASQDEDLKKLTSTEIIQEVILVTEKVIKLHPPENTIYIGMGRSPTPIMLALELLFPGSVFNLPLTGIAYENRFHKIMNANENEFQHIMNDYLKRLPSIQNMKSKKIVFIDYTSTGRGFNNACNYFTKFFNLLGIEKINFIALEGFPSDSEPVAINYELKNVSVLDMKPYKHLEHALGSLSYDTYSSVGVFDPSSQQEPLDIFIERFKEFKKSFEKKFHQNALATQLRTRFCLLKLLP